VSCKEASTCTFNIPVGRARHAHVDLLERQAAFNIPFRTCSPITTESHARTEAETRKWLRHRLQKRYLARLKIISYSRSLHGRRIAEAKATLGSECVILVTIINAMKSYATRIIAAIPIACRKWPRKPSSYIVFCGVHFMAESADILARPGSGRAARPERRLLHGRHARFRRWKMLEQFVNLGLADDEGAGITPITYMNSTAAIKGFCGERGGMVCTSSNAKGAFDWGSAAMRDLFLPDQHLGRNTGFARAFRWTRWWCGPVPVAGWPNDRPSPPSEVILWKGIARSISDSCRACGQVGRTIRIQVLVHPSAAGKCAKRLTASVRPII